LPGHVGVNRALVRILPRFVELNRVTLVGLQEVRPKLSSRAVTVCKRVSCSTHVTSVPGELSTTGGMYAPPASVSGEATFEDEQAIGPAASGTTHSVPTRLSDRTLAVNIRRRKTFPPGLHRIPGLRPPWHTFVRHAQVGVGETMRLKDDRLLRGLRPGAVLVQDERLVLIGQQRLPARGIGIRQRHPDVARDVRLLPLGCRSDVHEDVVLILTVVDR
jgi:hypothetical protein